MGQPMQVWMPLISVGPYDAIFERDFRRAQQAWQGEDLVWLEPSAIGETREVIP